MGSDTCGDTAGTAPFSGCAAVVLLGGAGRVAGHSRHDDGAYAPDRFSALSAAETKFRSLLKKRYGSSDMKR